MSDPRLAINPEAERTLIGAVLLQPAAYDLVSDIVSAEDFYAVQFREIWRAIETCGRSKDQEPDLMGVLAELRRAEKLDRVGGDEALRDLFMAVTTAQGIEGHARLVADAAARRRITAICSETAQQARSVEDIRQYTSDIANRLLVATDEKAGTVKHSREVGLETFEQHLSGNVSTGIISTTIAALDGLTGYLRPGCLTVVAARPGMGKTVLAGQIADEAAQHRRGVYFCTLEMPGSQMQARLIARRARVPVQQLMRNQLSKDNHAAAQQALSDLRRAPLWFDDSAAVTAEQIAARAKRLVARHQIKLVVVDYLQLLTASDPRAPREQQVSRAARSLKVLALSLKIPVLCVAQLNRDCEKRPDKRPRLSDLRESGAIENHADAIVFCYREGYYTQDAGDDIELIVAKNRHGRTGTAIATWEGLYSRISEQAGAML